MNLTIEELKFNTDGLIPAVVQDFKTKDVLLMLAYTNAEDSAEIIISLNGKKGVSVDKRKKLLS